MSEFTKSVEGGLQGCDAVSTGLCPGCEECAGDAGVDVSELGDLIENGTVWSESHFSSSPCDICGSSLGGDREVWHWLDKDGEIMHGDGVCVDCVMYLANGDEPEEWR